MNKKHWQGDSARRLHAVLTGEGADRPPVICPGGMMTALLEEALARVGGNLREINLSPAGIVGLAREIQRLTGFENFGLPFCLTLEAEILGLEIDYGAGSLEPRVVKRPCAASAAVPLQSVAGLLSHPRVTALAAAVQELSRDPSRLPVTVSLLGPVTLAGNLVEAEQLFKDFRKAPDSVDRLLGHLTEFLLALAARLIQEGAFVVVIADPTATGEILGPRMFRRFALPYLQRLNEGVAALGALPVLHICGNVEAVAPLLGETGAAAFSADSMVSLRALKESHGVRRVMGNVDIRLLHAGPAERIAAVIRKLAADGVDIIAPACGLIPASPTAHIRAMTDAVRAGEQPF